MGSQRGRTDWVEDRRNKLTKSCPGSQFARVHWSNRNPATKNIPFIKNILHTQYGRVNHWLCATDTGFTVYLQGFMIAQLRLLVFPIISQNPPNRTPLANFTPAYFFLLSEGDQWNGMFSEETDHDLADRLTFSSYNSSSYNGSKSTVYHDLALLAMGHAPSTIRMLQPYHGYHGYHGHQILNRYIRLCMLLPKPYPTALTHAPSKL